MAWLAERCPFMFWHVHNLRLLKSGQGSVLHAKCFPHRWFTSDQALSCMQGPPTISVLARMGGAVQPDDGFACSRLPTYLFRPIWVVLFTLMMVPALLICKANSHSWRRLRTDANVHAHLGSASAHIRISPCVARRGLPTYMFQTIWVVLYNLLTV